MNKRKSIRSVQFHCLTTVGYERTKTLTDNECKLSMDSCGVYYDDGDFNMMFPWHAIEYVEF